MTIVVDLLREAKSKARIAIVADQVSSTAPFPFDFYQAMKDGGWPMQESGVSIAVVTYKGGGKHFQGAIIREKGEPPGSGDSVRVSDSEPAFYVGKALESLNVPTILERRVDEPEGQITVIFEGGFPD
jgi:hypothetical protein